MAQPANEASLHGINVAVLVTDGFEQAELTGPCDALETAGAMTRIISNKRGKIQGYHHDAKGDQFEVNLAFDEAEPESNEAEKQPSGARKAEQNRSIPEAQHFVRGMQEEGKPIAAICHGLSLLVSAGLIKGRTLTSSPALQEDIRNAGGNWVDQEVVEDGNLVSSRNLSDIPAFNRKMIETMAKHVRINVRGTADDRPFVGAGS